MRWRSTSVADVQQDSPERDTVDGRSAATPSLDDDEPDSSSPDELHSDDEIRDPHGMLGACESDLPPAADHLLEDAKQSMQEEKKLAEDALHDTKDAPHRGILGAKNRDSTVIEDDDGFDHSQPPDEDADGQPPVIPWRPQQSQSTCEFTHTIMNYSQKRESGCKKAEYSATTVDEFGNRWRLIVYVNGNGRASNHHLSLFLQVADADDLPFGWKKAVSYVLTLEHPSGAHLSYAKRNPDKTFKLCPKAIDWGWSQFITSDRIQQEGFVANDSLTVRASVTVKSSSVSIDLEDAELYLKCAVEEGNAEAVKLCLAQGAGVSCKFKDDLYTPLHTACSSGTNSGSMEVLNLLLERGADGNAYNKWRETPLLIAANNGHRAAVEALLKSGADPSLCSEAGWSALTFAAHKGYEDIVALLLRAGAPVNCRVTEDSSTPLHKACAGSKPGHLSAVKQLLDAGADVHALNKWRETPLLTAANHGQAGAVDALLKAGADPCKCTDTGWSPLSIAAYKGHDDVVRLLLEEGAPTEEADPTLSALLQAATKGLPDTVELLLRHGADHTVTTKKGDTALSILVEQNLIDAAVEMVTEYKASVPRCSRDRKKVQRARLLINLRVKQQQREGLLNVSTDEDETDEDSDDSKTAQHDESESSIAVAPGSAKKKKKKGATLKLSAEEQARAAEEALLLELEQEDAKARKEEADANNKRAKKKKKKERERQQRLKEEQDRREREEKEQEERRRRQREREEKERKIREQKARELREKELKEAAEREKAAKKREKEEREKRQREAEQKQREAEQKQRDKQAKVENKITSSPTRSCPVEKKGKTLKGKNAKKQHLPSARVTGPPAQSPRTNTMPLTGLPGNTQTSAGGSKDKAWQLKRQGHKEVTSSVVPSGGRKNGSVHPLPTSPKVPARSSPDSKADLVSMNVLSTRSVRTTGSLGLGSVGAEKSILAGSAPTGAGINDFPTVPPDLYASGGAGVLNGATKSAFRSAEVPAVALYQQEKVYELLRRCSLARSQSPSSHKDPLGFVDENTIKRVLYRWMIRAAHSGSPFLDCVIPSWSDSNELTLFFQRQFIAESRRGLGRGNPTGHVVSMESLKEAGSAMATLCHSLANDVAQFRANAVQQLPVDWSDATLGVVANENARCPTGAAVVVSWMNRSQVCLPALTFAKLRDRYLGPSNRLLSALFVTKTRYDTRRLITSNSAMDFRLTPRTQACLSMEASVSIEVWSDPFSALSGNFFCGNFEDVDSQFGGLAPFSKETGGGEQAFAKRGGSVSVVLPLDNMIASNYVHKVVDMLGAVEVPLSFAMFVQSDCFRDSQRTPSPGDLQLLDARLGDDKTSYLRRVEVLAGGQHFYHCGEDASAGTVSTTGSMFVLLQNDAGSDHFGLSDTNFTKIMLSMGAIFQPPSSLFVSPSGFPEGNTANGTPGTAQGGYFDLPLPLSPHNRSELGTIGGATISNAFSPGTRRGLRHGRLFDLEDNGEEEQLPEVDVVSGMLNNLNVDDLFQNNAPQDVDIEAISLMGITAPPYGSENPGTSRWTSRFG